jgi:hypothetical protein
MKTQLDFKLLVSYIFVFVLLISLLVFGYTSSNKIERTVTNLANQKIPTLITASNLKRAFQTQTIQLYELYATNNHEAYEKYYAKNKAALLLDIANLKNSPEYSTLATTVDQLSEHQEVIANKFVGIMAQPDVDWDGARNTLAEFSQGANLIEVKLDDLVSNITNQTQLQAQVSEKQLSQLLNFGLLFTALLFAGLVYIFYHKRNQTPKIN